MDELANQLDHVLRYFGLESIVGLGVGAGGNILARFAFRQPTKVIINAPGQRDFVLSLPPLF